MRRRCVRPGHVLLWARSGHAAAAAIAFCAVSGAVPADAGAVLLRAHRMVLFAAALTKRLAVVRGCARVLHTAVPADQSVIAVGSAAGRVRARPIAGMKAAVGSDVVLHTAVPSDQPVVPVVSAVGQVLAGILVRVPAAVRTEIPIRVIAAVGAIMRVFARLVVAIWVKGAVVSVPGMVLRSGCSASPRRQPL